MIWHCPKCQQALVVEGRSIHCANGHNFDRARQGYLYLLLANQKSSREPGDNEAMITSRRNFLRAGHYRLLPETIVQMLSENRPPSDAGSSCLLDLGCGEGYYAETICSELLSASIGIEKLSCYGVDLSKNALRKASVSARAVSSQTEGNALFDYAVCSTHNLPVQNACVDIALNIFAPLFVDEVVRVLAQGGVLVRVLPGPRHLFQLKEMLYDTPVCHELVEIEPEFKLLQRQQIQYSLQLNNSTDIQNLLTMTPLIYNGSREAKEQLKHCSDLTVDIDFDVQLLTVNEKD